MNAVSTIEHGHLLADNLPGQGLAWLQAARASAMRQFAVGGFPSPRLEEWKYTNVSALEKKRYTPSSGVDSPVPDPAWLESLRLADAWSLVLVDGHLAPALCRLEGLPNNVVATGVADALARCPERLEHRLGTVLAAEAQGFLAFNTAYFSDGGFIDIPAGVILERPVQILHLSTAPESLANTRSFLNIGANAQAHVVETFAGTGGQGYLTAAVTEIALAENAQLEHYKVQAESDKAYHFGGVYARQQRSSRFNQHNLSFGGLLARHEIHSELGEAAECELNGLFLAKNRQHVDSHTLLHHAKPYGTSRETYRGVLADRARGVFQGRIIVHPAAQKTNAQMNNRNLLLSDDAEIDAKPQLEILADDVKCSHGVTVGQLNPESLFFLASRGIEAETARNMLTFAFANEMVEKITLAELRAQVQGHLLAMFPQTGIRKDWL